MKKYRAVYYARVSTEEEKQMNALENQCKDLNDCIVNNDWKLVDSYIDEGKSGTTTKKRDEYNRLFNDMKSDKYDIIVIKSQDRLMRKTMDWYIFINELVTNNKKLYIYMESTFYKTDDALISGIKAMLSEEYSRELSKKLNKAHSRREREGSSIMTNGNMLGYDQINGELIINEKEAEMVRLVYDFYVNHKMGINLICAKLKELGYLNKNGKEFTTSTIGRMLKNEKYFGLLICNKQHKDFDTKTTIKNNKSEWIYHENRIPIIIEKELWDKAQNIREGRVITFGAEKRGKRYSKHILADKIICGECNKPMWYTGIRKKNEPPRMSWYCSTYSMYGRLGKGVRPEAGCNMPNISAKKLDDELELFLESINENSSEILDELIKRMEKNLENHVDTEIKKLKSDIDEISKKRELLLDKFLDGVIKEDIYKTKSVQLDKEYNDINNKYEELIKSNTISSVDRINNIITILKEHLYKDMSMTTFATPVIDKIKLYSNYAEMFLLFIDEPIIINKSFRFKLNNRKDDV